MEALAHLVFEFFKIGFLSALYSLNFLIIFILLSKKHYKLKSVKKIRVWLISFVTIYFILFLFMFSHYGNHGLGDSARLPLPFKKSINEINGNQTYIEDREHNIYSLSIDKFIVNNSYVYGHTNNQYEK